MKYAALFTLGILTGLMFQHIPRRPWFRDLPATPVGHKIKEHWYIGGRRVEKSEYDSHYFNGGTR